MKASQQNARNGLKTLFGSSLYQVAIPEEFAGKTYGQLFNHYCNEGGLCIGLLRGTWSQLTFGPNSNRMPYVYTNPSASTLLYKCDKVFILSQQILTSYKASVKVCLSLLLPFISLSLWLDLSVSLSLSLFSLSLSLCLSLSLSLSGLTSLSLSLSVSLSLFVSLLPLQDILEAFRFANSLTAKKKKKAMSDLHSAMQSDLGEISSAQKSLERSLSNLTVDLVKRFDDMIQLQNNLNFMQSYPSDAAPSSTGGGGEGGSSSSLLSTNSQMGATGGGAGAGGVPLERSVSRTRITEEIQRRTMLKKSGSSGKGLS
jgi:hypothetical protein